MIRNPDGTPYRPTGSLQTFNPCGANASLFNKYDAETINTFGSPIYYYEIFINFSSVDKLYLESRDKIWSNIPIELYATYEPIENQHSQETYGIVGIGDVVFELNTQAVIKTLGHQPKIGSRIFTPHLGENWTIVDTALSEFRYWGAYRTKLTCTKWQGSTSDNSLKGDSNTGFPKAVPEQNDNLGCDN